MDIWKVLCIKETKDKDAIRDAYRKKLVSVNPEEDQQGFMELRRAYEQAMAAADRPEEENEADSTQAKEEQNTPIGVWLKKADALYGDIELRGDEEKWRELLNEDVCFSLETKTEVRDGLLRYFMTHNYLPREIWKLLDDKFLLREYKDELYEKFPADYINQGVIGSIEHKEFIDIKYTEPRGGTDFDRFFSQCYELYHLLADRKLEEAEQKFKELEELKIYHPYVDVFRIWYLLAKDKIDEAEELSVILKEKLPEDEQVLRALADVYSAKEEYDKAKAVYEDILKLFPNHYHAKVALGNTCFQLKEYSEAKKCYEDAYDIHKNDYLSQAILDCVKEIEGIYYQKWKENPRDIESAIELARTYYQQSKFELSIKLLLELHPDEDNRLEHIHLLGCNYMYLQEFEKALPYLKQWVEETKQLKEDGTEKRKKAIHRLSAACHCTAQALAGLKRYEEADEYLEQALATGVQVIDVYEEKARIYFARRKYDDVIKICDKIFEQDISSPIGHAFRAEIFYELGYYQDSKEEWDYCIEISPNNLSYYIRKADCFYLMEKYAEASQVLDYVKEHGAESDSIVMWEAMIESEKGNQEEALHTLLDLSIKAESKKDFEQVIVHRLYFEIARIYAYKNQNEDAEFYLDKALEADPHFVRGMIYKGHVCWREKRYEAAITCFLQALEEDPKHEKANGWIGEVYEEQEEYEKAIAYYTRQLDIAPHAFIYLSRGWCFERLHKYEEAKKDYKKDIQLDPGNGNTYCLLADIYMWEGQNEKAAEFFREGFERNNEEIRPWKYRNYAQVCRRLKQWDKAIELLSRCIEQAREPVDRKRLGRLYMVMGRYGEALNQYTQYAGNGENYRIDVIRKIIECLLLMKRTEDAERMIQKEKGEIFLTPDKAEREHDAGVMNIYLNLMKNKMFGAKMEYRSLLQKSQKSKAGRSVDFIYLRCQFILRKKRNPGMYHKGLEIHIRNLEEQAKSCDLDVHGKDAKKNSLLAFAQLARGHYEKAMEYAERALADKICQDCSFGKCVDALFVKAIVLEQAGKLKEAMEWMKKALELDAGDLNYIMTYERLREKMGQSSL